LGGSPTNRLLGKKKKKRGTQRELIECKEKKDLGRGEGGDAGGRGEGRRGDGRERVGRGTRLKRGEV